MADTIELREPTRERAVAKKREGLPVGKKLPPSYKFVYVHYNSRGGWNYDLENGFLPKLNKLIAKPGVNGVPHNGDLTPVITKAIQNGAKYIDPADPALGEDYQYYVRSYPTRTGGKYYVDFPVRITLLANDDVIFNKTETKDPWNKFLVHLRDAQIVEPLHREVFAGMLEAERAKRDQLYGRLDRNPHLKVKVEQAEARIDKMQEDFKTWQAKLAGDVAPIELTATVEKD
jgi:hypothetical protein|tara:strand:- start:2776 stop:3468 length:693 start_codon:yes stop_codon:yes gene_type:complete